MRLIESFEKITNEYPGPIPFSTTFRSQLPGAMTLFTFAIHGDEIGTVPAALQVMEELKSGALQFQGGLTFALGNIPAIRANKRFVSKDLNRLFNETTVDGDEPKRAEELKTLIRSSKRHFDFHQTIEPCLDAFYLAEPSSQILDLAKYLGVCKYFVEWTSEKSDQYGMAMSYARQVGCGYLGIEVLEKGYTKESHAMTLQILRAAVASSNHSHSAKQSSQTPLTQLKIIYQQKFDNRRMELLPGFKNLQTIEKGQILGTRDGISQLVAPMSGHILFPKYPERNEQGQVKDCLPVALFELATRTTA